MLLSYKYKRGNMKFILVIINQIIIFEKIRIIKRLLVLNRQLDELTKYY